MINRTSVSVINAQVMVGYQVVISHGSLHNQCPLGTPQAKSCRYLSHLFTLRLGKYVSVLTSFQWVWRAYIFFVANNNVVKNYNKNAVLLFDFTKNLTVVSRLWVENTSWNVVVWVHNYVHWPVKERIWPVWYINLKN